MRILAPRLGALGLTPPLALPARCQAARELQPLQRPQAWSGAATVRADDGPLGRPHSMPTTVAAASELTSIHSGRDSPRLGDNR